MSEQEDRYLDDYDDLHPEVEVDYFAPYTEDRITEAGYCEKCRKWYEKDQGLVNVTRSGLCLSCTGEM